MLCMTDRARKSRIKDIENLIDCIGHKTEEQLYYLEYRKLVEYLNVAKEAYIAELIEKEKD